MANKKKSIELRNELKYALDIMHEQLRYSLAYYQTLIN